MGKKLIAGNWKMNGTLAEAKVLVHDILHGIKEQPEILEYNDFLICPPFPYLHAVSEDSKDMLQLGGQDCSAFENGAQTGDVSSEMLADIGCSYVIVGHSERREYQRENDALLAQKIERAHAAGLTAILCVGEQEQDREQGREYDVVHQQLERGMPPGCTAQNTVIAYEPVWAIGTGKTATPEDAGAMHEFIRKKLQEQLADFADIRILYGGSMKPENAADLLNTPHIDGGLIGGASLDAEKFLAIGRAVL